MSTLRLASIRLLATLALALPLGAQGSGAPLSPRLLRPTRELKDTYAFVSGVHEVSGGRLLVVDATENRVWLVNPVTGARTEAVTVGSGPLEALSSWTVTRGSTETMIHDWRQHRMLVYDVAGKPVRTVVLPKLPAEQGTMPESSLAADDRGNIYLNSPPFVRGPGGIEPAATRAILRIAPDGQRVDTVVVMPAIKNDVAVQKFPGGGMSTQTGLANPFVPRDLWTVTGDGRVALVHGAPYRVEWIDRTGARTLGPVIPFTPIPITTADKQEYAAHHDGGGVATASQTQSPAGSTQIGGRDDWPAAKPPFAYNAVQADRDGSIWVCRTAPLGDQRVHYDVINDRGEVTRRVELPGGYKIIGFGRRAIYAVHETDGFRRLAVFDVAE